jgi:hypothetical protein
VASFPLQGQPNEAYVVLLDLIEQSTVIPSLGVTLDITDQFSWFSFVSPGFCGVTDNQGAATAATLIPNDPFFAVGRSRCRRSPATARRIAFRTSCG